MAANRRPRPNLMVLPPHKKQEPLWLPFDQLRRLIKYEAKEAAEMSAQWFPSWKR